MTRHCVQQLLLSLSLGVCAPMLLAQEPESNPAEQQFSPEQQARMQETAEEIERRYAGIQTLQENMGIYHPALGESYSDLGLYLSENERFDEAAQVYDQALQIVRINNGLYSAEQLPVIQSMIANLEMTRDWEEVDRYQEFNFHLHQRIYDRNDSDFIDSLTMYGEWKLRVLRENLLDQSFYRLSNMASALSTTYDEALVALDTSGAGTPHQMITLINGKSEADLMMATAIAQTPYTAFEGSASRFIYEQRCTRVRNAQGQMVTQCVNVRVENPQYRASQRSAKSFALIRYTRSINDSIEQLMAIRDENPDLSVEEIQQIDSHIAMLEAQTEQIRRLSRRESLL